MSDLERLDEALDHFAQGLPLVKATTEPGVPSYVKDANLLIAAARAYRDLLANGVREEWFCNSVLVPRCTEASRDKVREMFGGHDSCQRLAFLLPIVPTTEEER